MDEFESLLSAMERSDVKPWEFFSCGVEDLSQRTGRGLYDINEYKEYLQRSLSPPMVCGRPDGVIQRDLSPISTGVPKIDSMLGGGLVRGSVTEVSGPATSGKTCLCCQICVSNPNSIYFTAEERIINLQRRMEHMINAQNAAAASTGAQSDSTKFMKITTLAELKVALATLKHISHPPEVVLIDSLAALLDPENNNVEEQLELLQLRKIAFELQVAIVFINHVRDAPRPDADQLANCEYLSQSYWVQGDARPDEKYWAHPMHGLAVTDFIDNRLLLVRKLPESAAREARLVFSRWTSPSEAHLEMTIKGLV